MKQGVHFSSTGIVSWNLATGTKQEKWYRRFLQLAQTTASWSEDTNTQVGAVIFGSNYEIRSLGFNGFCRGVKPTPEKFERPEKYFHFAHAEENAIANAARMGTALNDCSIVVTHFPCMPCARMVVQSGLKIVVTPEPDFTHERWGEQWLRSLQMFTETQIHVIFINEEQQKCLGE